MHRHFCFWNFSATSERLHLVPRIPVVLPGPKTEGCNQRSPSGAFCIVHNYIANFFKGKYRTILPLFLGILYDFPLMSGGRHWRLV